MDRYQNLGVSLIGFGLVFGAYSYLVLLSVPLTSLGIACVVMGATLLMVPSSPVPGMQIRAMMEGSLVNVEALLEEYDAKGKAVYLPPKEGRVYAFIPVREDESPEVVGEVSLRVFTKVDNISGVIVFPPGSEVVRLSALPDEVGVEDALNHVLVDYMEAVEALKALEEGSRIVVELSRPRAETGYPRVYRSLGSPSISLAGCTLAYVLGKPLVFQGEEMSKEKIVGYFKRLG